MNSSWSITDDLDRVLRQNSLLLQTRGGLEGSIHNVTDQNDPNRTLGDWYNQSVLSQILVQYEESDQCKAQNLTTIKPDNAASSSSDLDCAHDLRQLNDILQSNGFDCISRGADIHEIINYCITAINELSSRTLDLSHRLSLNQKTSKVTRVEPLRPTQRESPQRVPAVSDADIEKRRQLDEFERLRKVCLAQHSRIQSLENHARLKDSELEKVKALMQERARREDRRGAITMTSMREQKLGTNGFVLVHNLQRQIEILTQENVSLDRKCRELSVRLRNALDGPERTSSDCN
jgi:hypothetical protein